MEVVRSSSPCRSDPKSGRSHWRGRLIGQLDVGKWGGKLHQPHTPATRPRLALLPCVVILPPKGCVSVSRPCHLRVSKRCPRGLHHFSVAVQLFVQSFVALVLGFRSTGPTLPCTMTAMPGRGLINFESRGGGLLGSQASPFIYPSLHTRRTIIMSSGYGRQNIIIINGSAQRA